jgi:very-short-patch-repair endonuclease
MIKRKRKICDNCNREIDLSNFDRHYKSCKDKKIHLLIKESWVNKNGKYECPFCQKEYSKQGIGTHIWKNHTEEGKNHNPHIGYKKGTRIAWNKGLSKETNESIKKGGETYKKRFKEGLIKVWCDGKHLSSKTKNKLSISGKLAHEEGRAWNIGMSRWNNEPSYPEKFFMKVIDNEFKDKNYEREYSIGIYSLDFAWINKKKVIEIDGEQHQRFEEYKERDKRKDNFLKNNGWKILRIIWKDMYNNTKEEIKKCKDFIDS